MIRSSRFRLLLGISVLAGMGMLAFTVAGSLRAQDIDAKSTYGDKELKAGFEPDPFIVNVKAGGPILTDKGDVKQYVAKEPDFRLIYTAGNFPLFIRAKSKTDTTLLVNLPDGTWLANDDSPDDGLNPLIKINNPKVGSLGRNLGRHPRGRACHAGRDTADLRGLRKWRINRDRYLMRGEDTSCGGARRIPYVRHVTARK